MIKAKEMVVKRTLPLSSNFRATWQINLMELGQRRREFNVASKKFKLKLAAI